MNQIYWCEYLIANNRQGVLSVLAKYGYQIQSDNDIDILEAVDQMQIAVGEEATIDLLRIHPDYEEIIAVHQLEMPELPKEKTAENQQKNNLDGILSSSIFRDVVFIVMSFWLIKTVVSNGNK